MTPAIPPEDDEGKTRLSRNWPGWLIAYIVTLVVPVIEPQEGAQVKRDRTRVAIAMLETLRSARELERYARLVRACDGDREQARRIASTLDAIEVRR